MRPDDAWTVQPGPGPVIATAIHDGHHLRPSLASRSGLDEATRRREEDPFTGEIAGGIRPLIVVSRSRFEVDLNRPRDTAIYREPADAWGLPLWREPLPDEEVAASLEIYDRFYASLHGFLTGLVRKHGRFLLLDVHSYNHRRGGPEALVDPPEENPDVNVGTGSLNRERWGPVVETFMGAARTAPDAPDVRENVRFRGGRLSRWVHDTFPEGGCCLAIEYKKLFMDEWTGDPDREHITTLARTLATAVPALEEALVAC